MDPPDRQTDRPGGKERRRDVDREMEGYKMIINVVRDAKLLETKCETCPWGL